MKFLPFALIVSDKIFFVFTMYCYGQENMIK